MPDWCENKLTISGGRSNVDALCRKIQIQSQRRQTRIASEREQEKTRKNGKCVYWNEQKGYGFIQPSSSDSFFFDSDDESESDDDVFVHFSAIHSNGARKLKKDERVEYDVVIQPDGRRKAINVFGSFCSYGYFRDDEYYALCGLKEITNNNSKQLCKSSANKPLRFCKADQTSSAGNTSYSRTFTVGLAFCPPLDWLERVAKRSRGIFFHLKYQTENPVSYGYVEYEDGELIDRKSIEQYSMIEKHEEELVNIIRSGIQALFVEPVRKSLAVYQVPMCLVNHIVDFCGQYPLREVGTLNEEFMSIWKRYSEDKNYTVRNSRESVFFHLFNDIEQKLTLIFLQHRMEVLDQLAIRFNFWDQEYGQFRLICEKAIKH